ncbi:endonuclease/exonuclease/phosphatase family protein [Haliovirga abyssi]|uniref:LuxR family transcriptional regulator n=1 Tax=Haliovirga abyssi TaxID=2996794 RepID=A0AAU9E357_9FUSO|nr:endonuclease/exonuclease/phosphatase family protein [Haliovirga abyssi]BDU50865.1 LuxR family transcriptional regulator [Haliovirga abyssi]
MKLKIIIIYMVIEIFTFSNDIGVISSFNSLHLGWKSKNYKKFAKVISLFDLIGLEEVMNETGIKKVKKELEIETGEKWDYHISEKKVGNGRYKEYYGYIWKENKVKFIKYYGFYKEKKNEFSREPYGAEFKIGKFDFTYILCHFIYGKNRAVREKEAGYLDNVYDYFQRKNGREQDVIIAGDFNLPSYNKGFKEIYAGKDNIFAVVNSKYKTTIGKHSLSKSYDNFFLSYKYTKEFTGDYGVYNFTNKNYSIVRKTISDHLPIFIEVDTTKDDD